MFLIRERPVSFLFFFFSPYVSYKGASCFFSFLFFFPPMFLIRERPVSFLFFFFSSYVSYK